MNKNECKIIEDLLPSYIDNVLSDESHQFVKNHLNFCANCTEKLLGMKEDLNTTSNMDQDKEINYLKKFNFKKNLIIFISIIITLSLCISSIFIPIPVKIDNFEVEWVYSTINQNGEKVICFNISSSYENLKISGSSSTNSGDKEIITKLYGHLPYAINGGYYCINAERIIDSNIEEIYIEDTFGERMLIWSKDDNIMNEVEFSNWLINEYVPQKLATAYGIYYIDNNKTMKWIPTSIWKTIYEKIFNSYYTNK